jgi:hypothetical protein
MSWGYGRPMIISDVVTGEIEKFKYLGLFIWKDEGFKMDVKHRIKYGWMKLWETSGVICDDGISQKLKGTFYRSAVRPTMQK